MLFLSTPLAAAVKTAPHSPRLTFKSSIGPVQIIPTSNGADIRIGQSGPTGELRLPESVTRQGLNLPVRWRVQRARISATHSGANLQFTSIDHRFGLTAEWRSSTGIGPLETRLTLINRTREPVEIPPVDTLSLNLQRKPREVYRNWWVEKSAGRPTLHGTHTDLIQKGFSARIKSTPYSEDNDHDAIPWTSIVDESSRTGLYAGIEFSGMVRLSIAQSDPHTINLLAGLDPIAGSRYRVLPGETWEYPVTFVGKFQGGVDEGANQLRRWVQRELKPKSSESRLPLATMNTWGLGMKIDEARSLRLIDDTKMLGLEMYHVDAGWFSSVGDWRPNPEKFPHGMLPISDKAHVHGLKFGLWTGWTQAGIAPFEGKEATTLNAFDPSRRDWLAYPPAERWKPQDFTGTDVCLSDRDAQNWCKQLLDGLVSENKVDMLEHDQRMVVSRCQQTDHDHNELPGDIAYRAANGYYSVYDYVRSQHPNLLFEDCVNGGRMVDFGVMRRASYISISDTYTPLENRQAIYDNSFAVPLSMCECYVSWIDNKSDSEFVTMLRSGMLGWFSLMQDPADWKGRQFELAQREIRNYKQRLRPLIQSGNFYHTSQRPSATRWDAFQYASMDRHHAALAVFRAESAQGDARFKFQGLSPQANYRCTFANDPGKVEFRSGSALMRDGLDFKASSIPKKGSQIVFLDRN